MEFGWQGMLFYVDRPVATLDAVANLAQRLMQCTLIGRANARNDVARIQHEWLNAENVHNITGVYSQLLFTISMNIILIHVRPFF